MATSTYNATIRTTYAYGGVGLEAITLEADGTISAAASLGRDRLTNILIKDVIKRDMTNGHHVEVILDNAQGYRNMADAILQLNVSTSQVNQAFDELGAK